jgi:hypothetical protein
VRQTKRRQEATPPQSAGKEEERRDKLRRQQEARMHLKKAREARAKGNDIPSHREQGHASSDDDSVATQLQSNAAKGSSNDKESRSLLQAKEGIDLPVFRGILPRQYLYRYDIKLQVPESSDAVAMLVQVAKNFWTQILAVDKSAVLVPWTTDHQTDGSLVTSLTKFPNLLSPFRKYFPRTNPNTKGMTLYTSMLMAHNLPYEDIMENIRWWLNEKRYGMWKRQVQAESTKTVGYLLYSTRTLEPDYMKATVENIVNKDGRIHKKHKKIELGFRWRVIPMGTQGKIKEEDLVRALHIECATEDYVLAKAILSDMYSATSVDFPGGIKM